MSQSTGDQIASFAAVDRVIANSLRFKLKLGIGADAYLSMKIGKRLQELWDVGGVAATGVSIAASRAVATTFFSSGGWLSAFGAGTTAVTPLGWLVAAAVVSGGAYMGVVRLFRSYAGSRVHTIPAFINSPVDFLGANLFDMMAMLGLKVVEFGGPIDHAERASLKSYFVEEWGFDPAYVGKALPVIESNTAKASLRTIAKQLASFQRENPDCDYAAMHKELVLFLRELAAADGILDEREELAIEKIDSILIAGNRWSPFGGVSDVAQRAITPLAAGTRSMFGAISSMFGR
jgi:uncharacterized tellurite resistance protein B-like protein